MDVSFIISGKYLGVEFLSNKITSLTLKTAELLWGLFSKCVCAVLLSLWPCVSYVAICRQDLPVFVKI